MCLGLRVYSSERCIANQSHLVIKSCILSLMMRECQKFRTGSEGVSSFSWRNCVLRYDIPCSWKDFSLIKGFPKRPVCLWRRARNQLLSLPIKSKSAVATCKRKKKKGFRQYSLTYFQHSLDCSEWFRI